MHFFVKLPQVLKGCFSSAELGFLVVVTTNETTAPMPSPPLIPVTLISVVYAENGNKLSNFTNKNRTTCHLSFFPAHFCSKKETLVFSHQKVLSFSAKPNTF